MSAIECKVILERFARPGATGRPIPTGERQTITVFVDDELRAAHAAAQRMANPAEWSAVSVQVGAPIDAKGTAHVDRSGAIPNCRCVVEPNTYTLSRASFRKALAAVATCEQLNYTHEGGKQWKPPLGPKPNIGADRTLLGELLAVIHRDGGQHQEQHGTWLAVRDAINVVQALRLKTEEKLKTYTIDVKVDATHVAAAIDSWLTEHKAQVAAREDDELEAARVEFEAWYLTDIANAGFAQREPGYMKSLRDGDGYGVNRCALNGKWKGWRAAKGLK